MSIGTIFLVAAVICFVAQAFGMPRIQWWALGVAFYIAAQLPLGK
jgi:hypothetical protein